MILFPKIRIHLMISFPKIKIHLMIPFPKIRIHLRTAAKAYATILGADLPARGLISAFCFLLKR